MGNTPPSVAQFVSIDARKGEAKGQRYEKQLVSYHVGDRTAKVSVKNITEHGNNKFLIKIKDNDKVNFLSATYWPYRFEMMLERAKGQQLLAVSCAKTGVVQNKDVLAWPVALSKLGVNFSYLNNNLYERDATRNTKLKSTPGGGIIETSLNPYNVRGRDRQRGLVVIEWKKKSWDQNPYMVTVSHYFASFYKTNVGFSVVAKIRGEDLQVEGPVFHPATSLFEMFDHVLRSGNWTPNACPHCATDNNSPLPHCATPNERLPAKSLPYGENGNQNQDWFRSLLNS
ncbi:hypothetical protein E2542_SST27436 [Spatholobus suberectus]|nr:hypothetical protein E2542_SST27436 [Spatholobus suberectus]